MDKKEKLLLISCLNKYGNKIPYITEQNFKYINIKYAFNLLKKHNNKLSKRGNIIYNKLINKQIERES